MCVVCRMCKDVIQNDDPALVCAGGGLSQPLCPVMHHCSIGMQQHSRETVHRSATPVTLVYSRNEREVARESLRVYSPTEYMQAGTSAAAAVVVQQQLVADYKQAAQHTTSRFLVRGLKIIARHTTSAIFWLLRVEKALHLRPYK